MHPDVTLVRPVPAPETLPAIAVVVVCHNSADALRDTLPALGAQLREDDEVAVVDNASADDSAALARELLPRAAVVQAPGNVGFAAGCHLGADATRAPLVLLLNPDAVPQPGFLDALRAAAADHPDWVAWQALVTMDHGALVNTAGNLVHWLGFGWAGGLGEAVDAVPPRDHEVGFPSGAAVVVRRRSWDAAGGFDERYFMYGEDLDLGLRLRLAGEGVGIVPAARADHDYAFVKGDYKWFYLERNRWWTVLGAYPTPLLLLVLPALLAFEIALLPAAWRGGWLRPKLRAQRAVLGALPEILRRRAQVQATRTVSPRQFASGLTASLDSPVIGAASSSRFLAALQRGTWRAILALLR
jgi:N-acetylglucosaminyl-diphospho-decaprenol L-rhamnosyltransferase